MSTGFRVLLLGGLMALAMSCAAGAGGQGATKSASTRGSFVMVLGVAQDAGAPQAGTKPGAAWDDPDRRRLATSLAVVDPASGQRWMIDATPDFKWQLHALDEASPAEGVPGLAGVFLTHAHMGHYTGLLHFGHEVMGAKAVPVFAMARMAEFLRNNGPWDQLVRYENIALRPLKDGERVTLTPKLSVTPLRVPHREEYSEVVGYRIQGPRRSVLFIPDIDKWEAWDERGTRVEDEIARVDVAYLDATFYGPEELPGRDMAEIPHPFIVESLRRFQGLPAAERAKIRFIHLNHSNPALTAGSQARAAIEAAGMRVAEEGERVGLD